MVASVLPDPRVFKAAVLIPVYNHEAAIGITLERVLEHSWDVLLVDDGSSDICRDVLIALAGQYPDRVSLLRLEQNGGKGAAVKAGFSALLAKGYTHAAQIDADGQHDISDLPTFMAQGQQTPEVLVSGHPKYDESVPALRYYGRYLTHVWVWINTLSFQIKDTMCGFRVYPLAEIVAMLSKEPCGNRMDFDTEIMVRWLWRNGKVHNLPTKVHYPLDGVSHFDVVKDNVLISAMHTRLFFGMLRRLPKILWSRQRG